jgi:hypothetical protein
MQDREKRKEYRIILKRVGSMECGVRSRELGV